MRKKANNFFPELMPNIGDEGRKIDHLEVCYIDYDPMCAMAVSVDDAVCVYIVFDGTGEQEAKRNSVTLENTRNGDVVFRVFFWA